VSGIKTLRNLMIRAIDLVQINTMFQRIALITQRLGSDGTADASIVSTGQLVIDQGGTSSDLSGTGPGIVQQATAGAPLTIATSVVATDIALLDAANVFTSTTGQEMKALLLDGSTSGTVTIKTQAVATTTSLTLPDAATGLVSTDTVQNISGAKTFTTSVAVTLGQNAGTSMTITNTTGGTSSQVFSSLTTALGAFTRTLHDAARVVARYGITLGGWAEIFVAAALNGVVIGTQGNTPIVFGNNNVESGRWNGDNSFQFSGNNGSFFKFTRDTELLTLSTSGTTTDTTGFIIHNSCIVIGVVTLVTTAVTGAGVTTLNIGDAGLSTRWATGLLLGLGAGIVGVNQWKGSVATDAAGPQATGEKVRVTAVGGTPTGGVVRIVTFMVEFGTPTS
jgi:hypothetical protein